MSTVIAFDQSTTSTGYAIFENNELVQFGNFKPKGDKKVDKRIYETTDFLKKIIFSVPNIQVILLEDIQLQTTINGQSYGFGKSKDNNVITFKSLAKLQGAMINTCIDAQIPYEIIVPSHWKKSMGITAKYRSQQKKEAIELVDSIYGENAQEDEADAICIGASYIKEKTT